MHLAFSVIATYPYFISDFIPGHSFRDLLRTRAKMPKHPIIDKFLMHKNTVFFLTVLPLVLLLDLIV